MKGKQKTKAGGKLKHNFKRQARRQKGITLIALIITIVILIILATVTINLSFGEGGLIQRAQDAKDLTEQATMEEQEMLNSLVSELDEITYVPRTDGSFSEEKGVNTPNLGSNMTLVIFDTDSNTWVTDTTKEGYSYVDASIEGNNKSEWANAEVRVNNEISYFVWIPRYAYRIVDGEIQIEFIKGTGKESANGIQCKYANENPTEGVDYIIHPAFTQDVNYGGWDSELPGIWIAKFQASTTDGTTIKFQPGERAFMNTSLGEMYTKSKAFSPNLESHMLKNSEWGAVAYLAESKYGRNGEEIESVKELNDRFTGGGMDDAYITNVEQSSTGNVYGIYDLVGTYEPVASAYSNQSVIETQDGSTKYATVYNGTDVSTAYKYGDATYETSGWKQDSDQSETSDNPNFGWHHDLLSFVTSDAPFFVRSGGPDMGFACGIFCSLPDAGDLYGYSSFRLALVV